MVVVVVEAVVVIVLVVMVVVVVVVVAVAVAVVLRGLRCATETPRRCRPKGSRTTGPPRGSTASESPPNI